MLRSLFWKEMREQAPVALAGIALAVVIPLILGAAAVLRGSADGWGGSVRLLPMAYVAVLWPLFALAAGAVTGGGDASLSRRTFLLSRPVDRRVIWGVKLVAGCLALAVVVGTSELLMRLAAATVSDVSIPNLWMGPGEIMRGTFSGGDFEGIQVLGVPGMLVLCFATAAWLSVFMRSQMSVAFAALVVVAVLYVVVAGVWFLIDFLPPGHLDPANRSLALLALALLVASGLAFQRGELLSGAPHVARAVGFGGLALVLAGAGIGSAAAYQARVPGDDVVFLGLSASAAGDVVAVTVARPDYEASRSVRVLDGATGDVLAQTPRLAWQPSVSPDGRWVTYLSNRGALGLMSRRTELRVMASDGSSDRLLLGLPGLEASTPVFSPDSARVLLWNAGELHLLALDEPGPGITFRLRESCYPVGWSPDPDLLILTCRWATGHRGGEVLWLDVSTGRTRRRVELPGNIALCLASQLQDAALSLSLLPLGLNRRSASGGYDPDMVVYHLMDVATGELTALSDTLAPLNSCSRAAAAESVIFACPDPQAPDGRVRVTRISSGHPPVELGVFDGQRGWVTASPLGTRIVVTIRDAAAGDSGVRSWLMAPDGAWTPTDLKGAPYPSDWYAWAGEDRYLWLQGDPDPRSSGWKGAIREFDLSTNRVRTLAGAEASPE